MSSDLAIDEVEELRELVPNATPASVAEAAKEANQELVQAGLVKEPVEFLNEHFGTGALTDAAGKYLDSNGQGGDGSGS